MSSSKPVPTSGPGAVAPTPQNTPLTTNSLQTAMSKPTVPPTVAEGDEQSDEDHDVPDTPEDGKAGLGNLDSKSRSAILGLVQQRLEGLMGQSSGYIESLPSATKKRVLALKGVQSDWEEIQLKYKKECLELEKKYATLVQPLYTRRQELISGKSLPTAEELNKGHEQEVKDKEEFEDSDDEGDERGINKDDDEGFLPSDPIVDGEPGAGEGIPQFWLTALRNHSGIADLITERDEKALEHLTNIRIAHLDAENPKPEDVDEKTGKGQMGFRLYFDFHENPFFDNKILEKTYYYLEELGYEGDFIFSHARGCAVAWKSEEQNLTKEIEIKKQRNKHSGKTRLVRKARDVDSFFKFFTPPQPPTDAQLETGDLDEEELDDLDNRLELDYTIGEDLKEKIIPRAIDYFTGKALRYELEEEDYEDLSDEDDDDDDHGLDDDDDDDDDDSIPRRATKKKGGARAPKASAGGGDGPGECKQQ